MERQQTQPSDETILSPDALGGFLIEDLIVDDSSHQLVDELLREVDASNETVYTALKLALHIHQNDRRKGGESYQNHVLQVAVTVARDFRLYDQPQLIAASLLHDSVEDHAIELAEVLTGKVHEDKGEARDTCFRGLKPLFGAETTAIIARLTNPIRVQLHKDKNATYRDHVVGAIASDISALIIKVADTLDNTRDSVIDAGTRNRLDKKYSTTIPVYIEALKKVDDLAMRPDVVQIILDRLSEAQKLVTQRLGTFACRATTSDDDFIPRVA